MYSKNILLDNKKHMENAMRQIYIYIYIYLQKRFFEKRQITAKPQINNRRFKLFFRFTCFWLLRKNSNAKQDASHVQYYLKSGR